MNQSIYLLPLAIVAMTSAATCLAPMSTRGTPLPGLVDAPQNHRPLTVGCCGDGLNSDSWFSPWDNPNTAPRRRLYLRRGKGVLVGM